MTPPTTTATAEKLAQRIIEIANPFIADEAEVKAILISELAKLLAPSCLCRECGKGKFEVEMFAGIIHPDGIGRGMCKDCFNAANVIGLKADLTQLRLQNEELRKSWQPIETAPKDGREVILLVKSRAGIQGKMLVGHFMEGGHCIEDHPAINRGWYFWNGAMFDEASEPTHWMPLPNPPAIDTAKEGKGV